MRKNLFNGPTREPKEPVKRRYGCQQRSWELAVISDASSASDMIWLSTEELAAVSDASSGHLQRCCDADTTNQCLSRAKDASMLSWPTITGH
eukprot:scaffold4291_cov76-Skeletonema_dohrnii-CCMP3373.AAC.2